MINNLNIFGLFLFRYLFKIGSGIVTADVKCCPDQQYQGVIIKEYDTSYLYNNSTIRGVVDETNKVPFGFNRK
jgi:hypothetical protein